MSKISVTRETAIANIKKFFKDATSDSVSVEDIYKAVGRNLAEPHKNRVWLAYKLTSLQDHGLFTRQYTKHKGQQKLVRIALTERGKRALSQPPQTEQQALPGNSDSALHEIVREITISAVRRDIETLRQKEPELEITFSIRLKENAQER